MRDFHSWLKKRQERGEHIPKNRDELNQIYRIEKPKFLMKLNVKSPGSDYKWFRTEVSKSVRKKQW